MSQKEVNTGYNDIKQVEMSVLSAEHMVGQATRSMDKEQLTAATDAVQNAKDILAQAKQHTTGVDDRFFEMATELLEKSEHQLREAKK